MEIILASASPRRLELLRRVGLENIRVLPSEASEELEGSPSPAETVRILSIRKAGAVKPLAGEDDVIIAADTLVFLDGKILGKPRDEEEAAAMLRALSGRRHDVYTGVTVLRGERAMTQSACSSVFFRTLEEDEIIRYIATGEPMDKAGAYGIQEVGSLLVDHIEGDFFNIMGLPLGLLYRMLRPLGVNLLAPQETGFMETLPR